MPSIYPRTSSTPHAAAALPLLVIFAATFLTACASTGSARGLARVTRADSTARAAIAAERSLNADSLPPRTVGVLPLTVAATDTAIASLGYGVADLVTTDLARARALTVVERLNVDALMRELSMGQSSEGRVDRATAPRMGLLLGARRLVAGGVAQGADRRIALSSMIVDVKSGALERVHSTTVSLDRILDAQKELTFAILDGLHVTLTPAEREAIARRPTRNVSALLAYSRGVRDEAHGDYAAASRQYAQALRLDPSFARARARLQELPALPGVVAGDARAASAVALHRALVLAGDPINRPLFPRVADVVDPSFRTNVQQMVTLIIRISVP